MKIDKDLSLGYIDALNPVDNYMFKINNRNTRTRCEICSKLTIETLGQGVKYVQS